MTVARTPIAAPTLFQSTWLMAGMVASALRRWLGKTASEQLQGLPDRRAVAGQDGLAEDLIRLAGLIRVGEPERRQEVRDGRSKRVADVVDAVCSSAPD